MALTEHTLGDDGMAPLLPMGIVVQVDMRSALIDGVVCIIATSDGSYVARLIKLLKGCIYLETTKLGFGGRISLMKYRKSNPDAVIVGVVHRDK